jgi:hypothetical protein
MVAYCWASGLIEIGDTCPAGALPLAEGDAQALQAAVSGLATLAYDNKSLLIPGLALAQGDAKLDRVMEFSGRLCACLNRAS